MTPDSAFGPYRVVDVTDEKGALAGHVLASLGAEVVLVEPPGGHPLRRQGPFYHDAPETSLTWLAYQAGKKSITLNVAAADGQALLRRLVAGADVFLESFAPGYLDSLGLGYRHLKETNPGLIYTSISPFGQSGPYRDYKATDLVAMAMGGFMYLCGDPARPPVRVSAPQAFLHAGAEAAVGTLIALYHRQMGGPGQHVDVSAQECVAWCLLHAQQFWNLNQVILKREGGLRQFGTYRVRTLFRCRDGYLTFMLRGGSGPGAESQRALVRWMDEEGMADDFLRGFDWDAFDATHYTEEMGERLASYFLPFFLKHTKAELFRGAVARGIMLAAINTPEDLARSPQLEARGFWVQVEHPELGESLTYPGPPVRLSATPWQRRRAPTLGEHNREVYGNELGLSPAELAALKAAGVV